MGAAIRSSSTIVREFSTNDTIILDGLELVGVISSQPTKIIKEDKRPNLLDYRSVNFDKQQKKAGLLAQQTRFSILFNQVLPDQRDVTSIILHAQLTVINSNSVVVGSSFKINTCAGLTSELDIGTSIFPN